MKHYELRLVKRRKRRGEWVGDPDSVTLREVAASSAREAVQKVMVDENLPWKNFGVEVREKPRDKKP